LLESERCLKMSYDLIKAIYNHMYVNREAFYTAISGRLFYGEAPQGTTAPYAVYSGSAVPEDTFDAEIDDFSIQFNLFADSAKGCSQALDACRAFYDGAVVTVSSNEDIKMYREMETLPMRDDDLSLWRAVIEFNFLMQKGE